ncbi:hypothetical protein [Streptomyces sp. AC550_RSS872]|uniref:hypothetical protein n=1 Tax=Streptomyces sp. AC550_RSS872 TaxID=2823689 RepID=UPI001C264A39|nr:hypothetical protein [Streptomyces sp. AC550_RSS872]
MNEFAAFVTAFVTAFVFTVQQIILWRYGVLGLLALLLFAIGVKARNQTCSTIGALLLVLMLSRQAL